MKITILKLYMMGNGVLYVLIKSVLNECECVDRESLYTQKAEWMQFVLFHQKTTGCKIHEEKTNAIITAAV